MKILLLISLLLFNPIKPPTVDCRQIIFTKTIHGFWKADHTFQSANSKEIWIVMYNNKAGYCRFVPPKNNDIRIATAIAVFPKVGYRIKGNFLTYIVNRSSKGTCWNIYDNNGILFYRGD